MHHALKKCNICRSGFLWQSECEIVTLFLQAATGLADGTLKVNRERSGMKKVMKMLLEDNAFGRNFVFNKGAYP